MAKIISYNVNGIRAALQKNLLGWLDSTNADVVCLQEIKANPDQVDFAVFEHLGYHVYWNSAEKKGYSGVAILSKTEANTIETDLLEGDMNAEGRTIKANFNDFSVMSVYIPAGSTDERQEFKYRWLAAFYHYIKSLDDPKLVITGDFNICRHAIDLHNPVANEYSSGFLGPERQWFAKFLQLGFVDSFRHFNQDPHNYTWWSYIYNSRYKNLGWRLDYQLVSESLLSRLQRALILKAAKHSDHCPTMCELAL